MENEEKKSYVNPDFTAAFGRVKNILIDLKKRIMPVKQGPAGDFRQNINNAIGTIPETNQETGVITKDGYGMSGAVFAMGEAVEKGLNNMDTALVKFTDDANKKFDAFANESKKELDNLQVNIDAKAKEEMEQATKNAQTAADNAIKATDAISNKFNKFLVVSQASVNNKPVDSSGNEIEQMPGGIWFRITSSTNNGENNTENGGIESTT